MTIRCDRCRREVEFTRDNSQLYWYVVTFQYNHLAHTCKCGGKLLYFISPTADLWVNVVKLLEGNWSVNVRGEAPDEVRGCMNATNARDATNLAAEVLFNRMVGEDNAFD